jgi:ribonucleoside-diphosphate reductase alpha chain
MNRERFPNRRQSEILEFDHEGNRFTLGFSRFHDGRIAEIFLSSNRPGSVIEAIGRDAAIVTSLALQHGAYLETIRQALTKDANGGPATLLGTALGKIAEAP